MKCVGSYDVRQWAMEVKKHVGNKEFMFRDLPEHLQVKGHIMQAKHIGLVSRSGRTMTGSSMGAYSWRMRI